MVYGARLESVLGASPQEFESLILRLRRAEAHRLGGRKRDITKTMK